jgi:hypothetical protein
LQRQFCFNALKMNFEGLQLGPGWLEQAFSIRFGKPMQVKSLQIGLRQEMTE